ncbi:neuroguidin isoform X1 [Canna indica]|uniref:Neuroguidin isoform X1 n=1 Tax=Canna indica TaxID=4628 RepID=A0AAQ3K9Q4_9LILI|nr:neuroguidin isoform X1 [Canna indica]
MTDAPALASRPTPAALSRPSPDTGCSLSPDAALASRPTPAALAYRLSLASGAPPHHLSLYSCCWSMSSGENLSPGGGEALAMLTTRETSQITAVLKEMKEGLDVVRSKVEALTKKVRENKLPTAEGMSYLDAKYLLLLSYCQSIVYYLLRKARGLSVQDHPVVRSLVEIRLFLEKIRPIDKKLEYQTQKLIRAASNFATEKTTTPDDKEKETSRNEENPLKYRPNPDMLVSKSIPGSQDGGGVYRPPRFAPTSMDEDKISKQEKQALRREKALLRQAKQSAYVKELIDDIEDRPEEISESVGAESRELTKYLAKQEDLARREEELFTRAPITKRDKKIEKHMKTRNGLLSLTDGFFDEIKMLPIEKEEETSGHLDKEEKGKMFKKRKRKH